MARPSIVLDIEDKASPPTMTICVVDRPLRYVTVELERVGPSREASFQCAIRQHHETDPTIFDLLAVAAESDC